MTPYIAKLIQEVLGKRTFDIQLPVRLSIEVDLYLPERNDQPILVREY